MASADRLIEVFNEAKARPPGVARDQYLDEVCQEGPALQEQVLALLRAHDGAGDFLQRAQLLPLTSPLTENPGDRIGRYKLLEQIGEGGCGVVYMAEQEAPVRRRVALKVIKLGMDTKQVIARFEAERQALAMMDHPNIAKVLEAGATETGRPFFVMELVRGIRITDFCDQNNLSTKERLELFTQVCQAIQHAHQKGVIHRDIKPSNILVTLHDDVAVPKVIDFGIAKATVGQLTDKTVFTAFAQFIGTPAYMSPEQARMSGLDVDTRADIYSLGVLLYELLTSNKPFDAKELLAAGVDEMRRKIREDEPPKPSTCLSTMQAMALTTVARRRHVEPPKLIHLIRGDLDWIVMKALEKDRTRRYETANGLAADIQRHLSNEPVTARPPSGLYRLQKMVQRNRGALFAGATMLAALLVAVFTLATSNARIRRERNQKDQALEAAREQLFVSLQSQAQALRNSHQAGQRLESLAALAAAARIRATPELRDNAIAAMAIPDVEQGPKWPVRGADLTDITYDLRYQRSARLQHDGTISIRTIPDDHEIQRLGSSPSTITGAEGGQLTFSPDGRLLARRGESGKLQVWQWESGELVLKSSPSNCFALTFSPDSRRLAVAQDEWITCFDLTTGEPSRRWQARDRVHRIEFNPDNRRIAAGYFQSNAVSIYNADDGAHLVDLPTSGSSWTIVAWHPDGNLLAMAGSDPRIRIWDVNVPRELGVLEGHAQQVNFLRFHWSGEMLASTSWDNVLRLWQPLPGRLLMKLPPRWMDYSREGTWVGAVQLDATSAQLWGIVPSQEYHTFLNTVSEGEIMLWEGDISPDGALLALASSDGIRLWHVRRGREVSRIRMGRTQTTMFLTGGRELLTCGPDDGLRRWSIVTNTTSGELELGPFHRIELPFAPARFAKSRDEGTLVVFGETDGGVILDLLTESVRSAIMPHAKAGYVALCPDEKRFATTGWHSERLKLWNATSGKLVNELAVGLTTRVFFTPGNELIAAHDREFTFHTLDSLAVSRRLPREIGLYAGHVAFTADGKMMAMEMAPGVIHLKEITSGRTVAKLEDPHGDVSSWIGFTPDGTQLLVAATYAGAIHRWDLRAIRERLKAMGLDWDWPAFSAASGVKASTGVRPTTSR